MEKNLPHLSSMFDQLAGNYDWLNRLFTFGLDKHWRRLAALRCLDCAPGRVLDLGTGTGDLALELARFSKGRTEIFAVDFSQAMLELARKKLERYKLETAVKLVQADAAALPFPAGYFDVVAVAFAFRNLLYHNPRARLFLREINRVLVTAGRLVVVETSQPEVALWKFIVRFYLDKMVAPLGDWFSRKEGAYRYLARSIANFYSPEQLRVLLEEEGLRLLRFEPLLGGVVGLLLAEKKRSEP